MRRKQVLISLIILLMIVMSPYLVLAREIELNTNVSDIKAGEEIKITIGLKNIAEGEGINSIQGQLVYDKNDWEPVKIENIKSKNNWSITYNNEETEAEGRFILINFGMGEKEEELAEITLKSKRKIISKETEIKLTELYTTDGENMIEMQEQVKKVNLQGNIALLLIPILALIAIIVVIVVIIKAKRSNRIK